MLRRVLISVLAIAVQLAVASPVHAEWLEASSDHFVIYGDQDLAALVAELRGGAVDTLLILDGNPVYDAPADLDLARALDRKTHV